MLEECMPLDGALGSVGLWICGGCYMRVWRKGRRVLGLHLCRVLSNCGSAWVFWIVVCIMRLSVYSRGRAFGGIFAGAMHL